MREMKDSGHPWLGMIPASWDVVYPKVLFTQRKDKAKRGERQLTASQQHGVVYQDEYMKMTGSRVVVVEKDFDILKHVEAGDFVISMRSFQGGVEYSENTGCISSAYVMLIPHPEYVNNGYFKWLLKSPTYIKALQSTSNLVRDGQAMRYSNFVQVWLPVIPVHEQVAIAEMLNRKCSQIDTLIANVQVQIEKLKAYKQSLITEVVTKGLDPTVPMKDSGVEWIGDVPEHWEILSLKHLCTMQSGKNLISEQIAPIGDYPVYGGNGLRGYFSDYNTTGDFLLVGRQGALCGNVHMVSGQFWATEHAVVTAPNEKVSLEYLYYLLVGMNLNQFVSPTAAQPGLAVSTIQNIKTCLPPMAEQQKAATYLHNTANQVDNLITIKQAKIEKLNEYKKSLIYEYVTGKKEVQ